MSASPGGYMMSNCGSTYSIPVRGSVRGPRLCWSYVR